MNVYEYEIYPCDDMSGWYLAEPFDFFGMTQGEDLADIALMVCDHLKVWAETWYIDGKEPPTPTYGNKPRHPGGRIVLVPVEDPKLTIRKTTPSDAARLLGVSPARITQLVKEAKLEAFTDEFGKRWVTTDSIECRLRDRAHIERAAKKKAPAMPAVSKAAAL